MLPLDSMYHSCLPVYLIYLNYHTTYYVSPDSYSCLLVYPVYLTNSCAAPDSHSCYLLIACIILVYLFTNYIEGLKAGREKSTGRGGPKGGSTGRGGPHREGSS